MTFPIASNVGETEQPEPASHSRCEHCGEQYPPNQGRDGYCYTCSVHIACPCRDED